MYELIILCYLARWPMHGYLIAKIINDMIGPYAHLSSGRLYPLLAKLESEGLIVPVEEPEQAAAESAAAPAMDAAATRARVRGLAPSSPSGGRRQRPYTITAAGLERFHELMMDTTSNPGEYARIFWFKLPCMYLLGLNEQLYLLDHYTTYCQAHIFHLQAETEDLRRHAAEYWQADPMQSEGSLYAMDYTLRRWRLELESVRQWRAHVVALAEGTEGVRGTEQASLADGGGLSANS